MRKFFMIVAVSMMAASSTSAAGAPRKVTTKAPARTAQKARSNIDLNKIVPNESWYNVRKAIRQGADINIKNKLQATPLMLAAMDNPDSRVIELLLAAGANLEATNVQGWTPLMFAARYTQNPDVVDVLLRAGAKISPSRPGGITPLMLAVCNKDSRIAPLLVQAGANLDELDSAGWTALMFASSSAPNTASIKYLLDAGANPELQNKDGWTALMHAARYDPTGAKVQALLDGGANINAQRPDGATALMLSCANEKPEAARTLIKNHANRDLTQPDGSTFVHYAAMLSRDETLLRLAIPGQREATITDRAGRDALSWAAVNTKSTALHYLIGLGVKLNLRDRNGMTALMHTLEGNKGEFIDNAAVLIAAGARTDIMDNNGRTVFNLLKNNSSMPAGIKTRFGQILGRK